LLLLGTFRGLNPVPALVVNSLDQPLFYIIALVGFFISVSSYFLIEKEGFGINTGEKTDKGYSRWSSDKEMKSELKRISVTDDNYPNAGLALINEVKI
jgi:hypothetical protein